jgi:hypothetical protein
LPPSKCPAWKASIYKEANDLSEQIKSQQETVWSLQLRVKGPEQKIDLARQHLAEAQTEVRFRLDTSGVMSHPMLSEVFHLTDQIVSEDEPLKSYLDEPRLPTN